MHEIESKKFAQITQRFLSECAARVYLRVLSAPRGSISGLSRDKKCRMNFHVMDSGDVAELKPGAIYGAPLLNEAPLKAPRGSFDIHYGRVGGQRRERYPAMRAVFLKYRRRNDRAAAL